MSDDKNPAGSVNTTTTAVIPRGPKGVGYIEILDAKTQEVLKC